MKKLLALLLALAMALSLAGCGRRGADPVDAADGTESADGTEPADSSAPAQNSESVTSDAISGTYRLTSMVQEGETIGAETMDALEQAGLIGFLQLNEDGSGLLNLFGQTTRLTWNDRFFTIEDEPVEFSLAEGALVLEQEGSSLSFHKVSSEITDLAAEVVDLETKAQELSPDVSGTYTLFGMTSDDVEYSAETLQVMNALGLSCALLLDKDGTGSFYLYGSVFRLSWDQGRLYLRQDDGSSASPLTYTLKNHVITLEKDGSVLRFLKISDQIEEIRRPELGAFEDADELEADSAQDRDN